MRHYIDDNPVIEGTTFDAAEMPSETTKSTIIQDLMQAATELIVTQPFNQTSNISSSQTPVVASITTTSSSMDDDELNSFYFYEVSVAEDYCLL
jgi:hypothetical protein